MQYDEVLFCDYAGELEVRIICKSSQTGAQALQIRTRDGRVYTELPLPLRRLVWRVMQETPGYDRPGDCARHGEYFYWVTATSDEGKRSIASRIGQRVLTALSPGECSHVA